MCLPLPLQNARNVLVASEPGAALGMAAKVADLGLSKVIKHNSHHTTNTVGTMNHTAPGEPKAKWDERAGRGSSSRNLRIKWCQCFCRLCTSHWQRVRSENVQLLTATCSCLPTACRFAELLRYGRMSPAIDVYSFGVMMHQLYTNQVSTTHHARPAGSCLCYVVESCVFVLHCNVEQLA
jgi:serine/threonine protein kinase